MIIPKVQDLSRTFVGIISKNQLNKLPRGRAVGVLIRVCFANIAVFDPEGRGIKPNGYRPAIKNGSIPSYGTGRGRLWIIEFQLVSGEINHVDKICAITISSSSPLVELELF